MPNSPSSCHDEQETARSSASSIVAPLSPQTDSIDRADDPNAMLLVVGGMSSVGDGTRLDASRSRNDRLTEAEKKNDIISNSTPSSFSENVSAHLVVLPPPSHSSPPSQEPNQATTDSASGVTASRTSSLPTTLLAVATSSTHQEQINPPISSDIVRASIKAAVASMGERPSRGDREDNIDSDKESGDEDAQADSSNNKMSIDKLLPSKKPRRKRTPQAKPGQTNGRWTQAEHRAFLEGLKECGREWKKVAQRIPTRTSAQIRSHAQKYFSKLQRDHDTALLPETSLAAPSSGGVGCATAAVPASDARALTPGVQRNVQRILANPEAAQREVESTLEALRERYRQLQLRLEQRQEQRRARHNSSSQRRPTQPHHVPDDTNNGPAMCRPPPRKRGLADVVERPRVPSFSSPHHSHDDLSSVSSNLSASVASMGNDELIALQVLGGALPRGESNQDLERMAVRASLASDDSVSACSATSAQHDDDVGDDGDGHPQHHDEDDGDEDRTPKRPKSN